MKLSEIDKDKKQISEKISEQDDEISAVKIDLNHNSNLLVEENNRLAPLRDRKMESLAKLQKINLDMSNLDEEETRVKNIKIKLEKTVEMLNSDLEREKSISLDASLNEKRILEEKNELLKTERTLFESEDKSEKELTISKANLKELQNELNGFINLMENNIDAGKKITKAHFQRLKQLINQITSSQEKYASSLGKNESMKNDSIKRKERIKNIDLELENWKNLKTNSEKMTVELNERKNKIKLEVEENQKNPEKIATIKGQNIQNLENTKKTIEEINLELSKAEEKYNLINENLKTVQEKLAILRENKARNEATVDGIEKRKKDLVYSIRNDLKIEEANLLTSSDLNFVEVKDLPKIEKKEEKLEKTKKERETLGSVNLRADEETKKYQDEIKKMEDDRTDIYSAIVKLKSSIDELNQKGREKLLDAFTKINKKFNEVYTKLFSGGNSKVRVG